MRRPPTMFLGAGASRGGAAALPMFADLQAAVLRSSGVLPRLQRSRLWVDESPLSSATEFEQSLQRISGRLAPEAALYRLRRAGVDVARLIVTLMNNQVSAGYGLPNGLHRCAARALTEGGLVWSPNYDTLVEDACQLQGFRVVLATPTTVTDPSSEHRILKVHGTLPARHVGQPWVSPQPDALAFDVEGELADLPAAWLALLQESIRGRDVVVVGYRGADIDLYPLLAVHLPSARSVLWTCRPGEERALHERFPTLRQNSNHHLIVDANPGAACLEAVIARWPELDPGLEDHDLSIINPLDLSLPEELGKHLGELHLSQLAAQLGFQRYWTPAESGQRLDLGMTLRGVVRRGFRLRAVQRLMVHLPSTLSRRWREQASDHITSSTPWPDIPTLRRWASQDQSALGVHLALARRLNWEGDLGSASQVANEGRTTALRQLRQNRRVRGLSSRLRPTPHGVPDRLGGFSFQLSDALRAQGLTEDARAEALIGYAGVSSVALALWQEFVKLACVVTDGLPLDTYYMRDAEYLLEDMALIGEPGGIPWCQLLIGISFSLQGSTTLAHDWLRRSLDNAIEQDLPRLQAGVYLHLADLARREGDKLRMVELLQQVGPDPLLSAMADLIRASTGGGNDDKLDLALWRFQTSGCWWGTGRIIDLKAGKQAPFSWL